MVMALLLLGAAAIGGGGVCIHRLLGVLGRAEGAIEGIANDVKELLIKEVWPNTRPLLRVATTLLLVLTILQCDAFLKGGPHAASEWLAYCVYYPCWMCALYFILKVLVSDVLKINNNNVQNVLSIIIIILGILHPLWEFYGDFFISTCVGDFLKLPYIHLRAFAVMLVEYISSFSPFSKN